MRNFRAYIIGLLFLPIVAVGALFFIPGPDGNPLMNMAKLRQHLGSVELDLSLFEKAKDDFHTITEKAKNATSKTCPPEAPEDTQESTQPSEAPPETVFTWRDENGVLHFSNQRPEDGAEYEIVESE